MDSITLLTLSATIVSTLFGILIAVLSWMGNKLYEKVSEMASTMYSIKVDLHKQTAIVENLDRRVTRLEDHVNI